MNKQEALKQIEEQRDMILELHGWGVFGYIKGIINQLDEPQKIELPKVEFKKFQKVKVPPSVAVWYEINKDNLDKNIAYLCLNNWGEFINDKTLFNWMSNTDNFIQILVNMHQFGYEVEEEKRYTVRIKGVEEDNAFLNYYAPRNEWFMDSSCDMKDIRAFHTRKELEEAGFGWVFDCPGVEVQEVE